MANSAGFTPRPKCVSLAAARNVSALAMNRLFTSTLLGLLMLLSRDLHGAIANAWHIPANTQTGIPSTMRDPFVEIAPTSTFTVYSGFFKNGGAGGNQTGGWLIYKNLTTNSAWQSVALGYHADVGGNQFWKASINAASFGANDVIAYYLKLTFSDRDDTYLYGGDIDGNHRSTGVEATAQASPYSFRNRPAWIFHAGNRVVSGNSVSFWSKVGYIGDVNTPSTQWATNGAVYYTTDGSTPAGSLGVGSGTTQVALCSYDHPEQNLNEAGSITGAKPMWWVATAPSLLQSLPLGATIKYKVGFWHSANTEERFADFNAATNNQVFTFTNGTLGDPVLTVASPTTGTLNGNYTTTKVFADEVAATSVPITINFAPGQPSITAVEVVTNLNQRDYATGDKNANGIEDGMEFNQTESLIGTGSDYYYRSYPMTLVSAGNYTLTLNATKTGAYRLSARWKVTGDTNWRWFTNVSAGRRDHAITVSPVTARTMNMYEINTLTVEAKATGSFIERSTFEDLYDAPGAPRTVDGRGFNLDYLEGLGVNMLWFQPVHPAAIEGRETDPATGQPYSHGSPYAVKNFFEIDPWMSASYNGTDSITGASARAAGMSSFQGFVSAADTRSIGVMLDAPFNHTGFDAELGQPGIDYLQRDGETWSPSDLIKNREARFYSLSGDYAQRASGAGTIAVAPDRGDFGKWNDVKDVYFGRYSALVNTNPADNGNHLNENDEFLYGDPNWTSDDDASANRNANVTKQVWKYFARYATYWLEKTRPVGQNRNSTISDGTLAQRYAFDGQGIDGLRCDFGQGLPPQCWEYIINTARSKKWSFVMMSESLDGGAVTYRSNRHFDVLNENIVFPLKSAGNAPQFRQIFEDRRSAYGQGMVLLNTTSHDEENYSNIFHPLMRHYVTCTMDGAPMVFMGQELGVTTTSGFTFYETNFGKQIAHFKKFNSMQPAWLNRNTNAFGEARLFDAFAAASLARKNSPALRGSKRWFLNLTNGSASNEIWAVAKYEQEGVSPNFQDVVFCFSNLRTETASSGSFNVGVFNNALVNIFGMKPGRSYGLKNIAAYIGPAGQGYDQTRRDTWFIYNWASSLYFSSGIPVTLNALPSTNDGWKTAPFEPLYYKLYDTGPPVAPSAPTTLKAYAIGNQVTFNWNAVTDTEAGVAGYKLTLQAPDGQGGYSEVFNSSVGNVTSYTFTGTVGQTYYAQLWTVSPVGVENSSTSGAGVTLLDANGDYDGDGMINANEDLAGTDPLSGTSSLKISSVSSPAAGSFTVTWASVVGKTYRVQACSDLVSGSWTDVSPDIAATSATSTWTDASATGGRKFYRARLVR